MGFWCFRCGKHDSNMSENQTRCPFCGALLSQDKRKKQYGLQDFKNYKNSKSK